MLYMGSKRRLAKDLERIILERVEVTPKVTYWEPFLGGANSFERLAPHFRHAVGVDVNEDLVLMWDAAVNGGWVPPLEVSKTEYDALRVSGEHSALRGFVGFGCSFGGKWWGGLAHGGVNADGSPRNRVAESARNVLRTVDRLGGVECKFECGDYRDIAPRPGDVVYCDPPYAGVTGYGVEFDSSAFWAWAYELAGAGVHVFVSEYQAPEGWVSVFEKRLFITVNKNGKTERPVGVEHIWVREDVG